MTGARRRVADGMAHVVLACGVILAAAPVYLAFAASTLDTQTLARHGVGFWPAPPGAPTFGRAFEATSHGMGAPWAVLMINALVSACLIAGGKVALAFTSAFAIAYFRFPFRRAAAAFLFATLLLPIELRMAPTLRLAADLSLIDTAAGLAFPLCASAAGMVFLRRAFDAAPALVDAARLDGAGPARFARDILWPSARADAAALFAVMVVYGWNQYLWPLLATTQESRRTIVLGMKTALAPGIGDGAIDWPVAMAAALLALAAPVAVALVWRRAFIKGVVGAKI